jgi:hypothetical protein
MSIPTAALARRLLAVPALVALAGCTQHPVGPARTFATYEGKAATSAESARSSVETVRLGADAGAEHSGPGPYLSVLISDQEDALAGVEDTFRSIQPPDDDADELGAELGDLLARALDHVTDVRIALRRGQFDSLVEVARPLARDSAALERFVTDHG